MHKVFFGATEIVLIIEVSLFQSILIRGPGSTVLLWAICAKLR